MALFTLFQRNQVWHSIVLVLWQNMYLVVKEKGLEIQL